MNFMLCKPSLPKQQGLTLVEILVAMVLGVFLIGSVLEAYLSAKQSSVMQDNLSRLQENARLAMDRLSHDIRLAGYHGNSPFNRESIFIQAGLPIQPDPATFITGTHHGQPNFWPASQQAEAIPETDTVTVIHASSCGGKLQALMATPAAPIQISAIASANCNINANDALFITDDRRGDIFFATNTGSTNVTHAPFLLRRNYRQAAELYTYHIDSFYLGIGASGRPSLFRYDNVRNIATEIVEDIEDMQIMYGITDKGIESIKPAPLFYTNADGIGTNSSNIVSVKISIVAVTVDAVAQNPTPYTINGVTVTPPDNRIRRVFSTVLSLRNLQRS